MPKCIECGAEYFPGDSGCEACADCLSARIEFALLRELRDGQRKPMKRMRPVAESEPNGAVEVDRKSA